LCFFGEKCDAVACRRVREGAQGRGLEPEKANCWVPSSVMRRRPAQRSIVEFRVSMLGLVPMRFWSLVEKRSEMVSRGASWRIWVVMSRMSAWELMQMWIPPSRENRWTRGR